MSVYLTYLFVVSHLCFGLDCGFLRMNQYSSCIKHILSLIPFFLLCVSAVFLLLRWDSSVESYLRLTQCFTHVFILLSCKYNVYDFLQDISLTKIDQSHTSSLYKIVFALYSFIFIFSDGAKIAFLMAQNSHLTISFIMFCPTLGVDLVSAI